MSKLYVSESAVEDKTFKWLQSTGWKVCHGGDIAPDSSNPLRTDYGDVVLGDRLKYALVRINPDLPQEAINDAERKLIHPPGSTLEARNRAFHRMVIDGVTVNYNDNGHIRGTQVKVIDFDDCDSNDWLAVRQFTVKENRCIRRPDVVLFVNGLPLVVIELKNPSDEKATIWSALQQLQTYKSEIPSLFTFNAALIISDGLQARIGTLTSGKEWFKPWRSITGAKEASLELQVLTEGVLEPKHFLSLLRDFIVFEDDGSGKLVKKMAGYHQYHVVEVAIEQTLRATQMQRQKASNQMVQDGMSSVQGGIYGDRRIGVVWHTQGSGKSLTMAFYAGRIIREPAMENPTIIVLTDRNDLDDQLFTTFTRCEGLLRQEPYQAGSRADLRSKLAVQSGGVVFTTIQKFFPNVRGDRHQCLSDRKNIVVIADEAHRSQYDFIDGYARHMRDALPNASFIGFTGTPIEHADADTRAVFGDHISIYDIYRSIEDGATVPIYYENRVPELTLDEKEKPSIDSSVEEITEDEEATRREKVKTRWAQLEAIVGSEKRIKIIARDIVTHFEKRLEAINGKAMIVCMSRRICIDLYQELVDLRPEWHSENDGEGNLKVIMTGSASDPQEWQQHIRDKSSRELLAKRFRDPEDQFKIVLVRDMWLTGFDAPSLHTMYIDKPMRGHGLMQAIARVNRVFRDKPAGLVVDYLGLAHDLKQALITYTDSGGKGEVTLNKEDAVRALKEKYEICCDLFHDFDHKNQRTLSQAEKLDLLPAAMEHVLAQEDGKNRCVDAVRGLRKAYALAVPHEYTDRICDDVAFFQAVQIALSKRAASEGKTDEELDHAMRQIVSQAVVSGGIVDIFSSAGLRRPDISVLSEQFLEEVRDMQRPNLAVELLRKLLKNEIRTRSRKNVVQARSFAEMLEKTVRHYQNRALDATEIIEELIQIARKIREASARGEKLGLSEDELAFYDALKTSDSAAKILGDDTLRKIAHELVETVRNKITIDWTLRENVRAKLRSSVKRVLRKHDYPPDKKEKATETVIEQAKAWSDNWVDMQ